MTITDLLCLYMCGDFGLKYTKIVKAREKVKTINIKVDAIRDSEIKLEKKSLAALLKKKLGYRLVALQTNKNFAFKCETWRLEQDPCLIFKNNKAQMRFEPSSSQPRPNFDASGLN